MTIFMLIGLFPPSGLGKEIFSRLYFKLDSGSCLEDFQVFRFEKDIF